MASTRAVIVTHAGPFHADELFGVAVLLDLFRARRPRAVRVRRDRLSERLEGWRRQGCEVVACVDIGERDDAAAGFYDHHQRGFAAARPNGLAYASFGLVWRAHGPAWLAQEMAAGALSEEAAATVDRILVQTIDASDTGATFFEAATTVGHAPILPATVSVLAGWRVPTSGESKVYDAAFRRSIRWAGEVLRGAARAALEEAVAGQAIAAADDGGPVVVLERPMNWFHHARPHHRFVIFPGDDETLWYLQAVPSAGAASVPRIALPAAWGGLRGSALAEVTGVAGAIFCHVGCWIAGAASRAEAERLVAIALSNQ